MQVIGERDAAAQLVWLAPGLPVDDRGRCRATDLDGLPGVEVEMLVVLVAGRYQCRELRVWQRETGAEVTGETLRAVPVATILRGGAMYLAGMANDGVAPPAEVIGVGPTSEALRWVAWVYRLALVLGDAPRRAVGDTFQIRPSTASNWIARAREAGYLEPADGPGKAGG